MTLLVAVMRFVERPCMIRGLGRWGDRRSELPGP
jgi:hypothetical protein